MTDQAQRARRFLELHVPGTPLLMPNPWDAGSATLLASLGFEALATTSSGLREQGTYGYWQRAGAGSDAARAAFDG